MEPETSADARATCPRCERQLHDEPVVVDHALRLGLVCPDHGLTSVEAPFADALTEPVRPSESSATGFVDPSTDSHATYCSKENSADIP